MAKNKLKTLIVEDDFVSRRILKEIISPHGECDMAKDGEEAISAFCLGWEEQDPYDLILMDIMMPIVDGQEALQRIRDMENEMGVKKTAPSTLELVAIRHTQNAIGNIHQNSNIYSIIILNYKYPNLKNPA